MESLAGLGRRGARRGVTWGSVLLALALAPTARAEAPVQRVDAALRLAAHRAHATGATARRGAAGAVPTVRVYLEARDVPAVRARVVELGGRVGTTAGSVLTATLPWAALAVLAEDPNVVRIEGGTRVRPKLDRVAELVNVLPAHQAAAPFAGLYRGAGVVVGVVDLSLDLTHPAFELAGRSRVVALWNHGGRSPNPPGYDYGSYCAEPDLVSGKCNLFIDEAHGTHVTGIAAGSRVGVYSGMAPASDIVFVNLGGEPAEDQTFDEWLSTAICDGVAFVFAEAAARGEPAVVNLSLGTHTGPHDGSTLEDACLDALTGPGRVIVAASGNEGEPWIHPTREVPLYVHASGTADASPARVSFVAGDYVAEGELIDLWFDEGGAEPTLQLGVVLPDDTELTTDLVHLGDGLYETMLSTPTAELGPIVVATDVTPSGAKNFRVTITDEDGDLAELEPMWFIELVDTGRFDGWLDVNGGGGFLAASSTVSVDATMSIGYPAVARGVIAVGSTVSRTTWSSIDGEDYETYDYLTGKPLRLGQLSTFSSRGPSRNPERTGVKPDLVAPGEMVVSAMPTAAWLDIDPANIVVDAPTGFVAEAGTSMSSPVVAGIIALLLERDPSLDPDGVRALLRQTALVPMGIEVPSDDWGYGRVDAAAALAAAPEVNPGEPVAQPKERGCGCALPTPPGRGGALAGLAALVVLAARWRFRRDLAARSGGFAGPR